jgi:hypothetical protein
MVLAGLDMRDLLSRFGAENLNDVPSQEADEAGETQGEPIHTIHMA